jgi:hypothetical protein
MNNEHPEYLPAIVARADVRPRGVSVVFPNASHPSSGSYRTQIVVFGKRYYVWEGICAKAAFARDCALVAFYQYMRRYKRASLWKDPQSLPLNYRYFSIGDADLPGQTRYHDERVKYAALCYAVTTGAQFYSPLFDQGTRDQIFDRVEAIKKRIAATPQRQPPQSGPVATSDAYGFTIPKPGDSQSLTARVRSVEQTLCLVEQMVDGEAALSARLEALEARVAALEESIRRRPGRLL